LLAWLFGPQQFEVCGIAHPFQVLLRGGLHDPRGAVLPYASLLVDGVELARSGVPVAHTRTIPLALG